MLLAKEPNLKVIKPRLESKINLLNLKIPNFPNYCAYKKLTNL
jgi:hypothetical protein